MQNYKKWDTEWSPRNEKYFQMWLKYSIMYCISREFLCKFPVGYDRFFPNWTLKDFHKRNWAGTVRKVEEKLRYFLCKIGIIEHTITVCPVTLDASTRQKRAVIDFSLAMCTGKAKRESGEIHGIYSMISLFHFNCWIMKN